MLKIKIVGKMTLTQNGRRAAFTVTAIEADENNILNYKYGTQIFTTGTFNNSVPIQLTTTKDGASRPAWSAEGEQIAFNPFVADKMQIFILSMEGGESV